MVHPRYRACPATLPVAGLIWFCAAVAPAAAGDRVMSDRHYPDRTPGYVEEVLGHDALEIETSDIAPRALAHRALQARSATGRIVILGLEPTTPVARNRAERFMETYRPPPRVRLQGSANGTVGIAIDF